MDKKYTVEGTYSVNGSEDRDFSFDYTNTLENEENSNKLIEMLDKPWKLILQGGKYGVKGVKRFFSIVFLFMVTNTFLTFYAFSRLIASGFGFGKAFTIAFVFFIGIGFTIYAGYRAYKFMVVDLIRVLYVNGAPFFQKICDIVINKVQSIFSGKKDVKQADISKALNFSKMIHGKYQTVPRFIRKGIIMVLSKVPFVGMLVELQEDISSGNTTAASAKLFTKVDGFISGTIFGMNTTKWLYWLLPLNIVVLYFFIKWKIG